MKHKKKGQSTGHGTGPIVLRVLGRARRGLGVQVALPEGKTVRLGRGRGARRKYARLLAAEEAREVARVDAEYTAEAKA